MRTWIIDRFCKTICWEMGCLWPYVNGPRIYEGVGALYKFGELYLEIGRRLVGYGAGHGQDVASVDVKHSTRTHLELAIVDIV